MPFDKTITLQASIASGESVPAPLQSHPGSDSQVIRLDECIPSGEWLGPQDGVFGEPAGVHGIHIAL